MIFHTPEIDTTRNRILVGIMSGILGIILMTFSVDITDHIILDFRNIAIILSSLYGGLVGAFFTGLIIGIFRLFYLKFTISSVFGVITIISAPSAATSRKSFQKSAVSVAFQGQNSSNINLWA